MDKREQSEKYADIGQDLIATEEILSDIAISNATIVYLTSEHEKRASGKVVCAECEKIPDKYKWCIPCDYTITVFEPNVEDFTEEQLRILILHELMHIKIKFHDDGTEEYEIRPHDVEEFRDIIDRFGLDWDRCEGKSDMDMLVDALPAFEI